MKLPIGWPDVKLPRGWPDPMFDERLVEAVQDPQYHDTLIGMEQIIRQVLQKPDIGAVIQLPYFDSPYLRKLLSLLARRYRLRPVRNSTISFQTKTWIAPLYILSDIPLKKVQDEGSDGAHEDDGSDSACEDE